MDDHNNLEAINTTEENIPFIRKAIPCEIPDNRCHRHHHHMTTDQVRTATKKTNEIRGQLFDDQIIHLITSTEQCRWSLKQLKLYAIL